MSIHRLPRVKRRAVAVAVLVRVFACSALRASTADYFVPPECVAATLGQIEFGTVANVLSVNYPAPSVEHS